MSSWAAQTAKGLTIALRSLKPKAMMFDITIFVSHEAIAALEYHVPEIPERPNETTKLATDSKLDPSPHLPPVSIVRIRKFTRQV
jgi:hypothetical protein